MLSAERMGRPKEYDRAEVLERASELFWKKGYEGTHLQELVEITGLNRFSLYKEFGGKEGLFRAALDNYFAWLGDLGKVLFREPLGLQNIRDYLENVAGVRFKYGCFLINTLSEKHLIESQTFSAVRDFIRGSERQLEANLRAAREAGEVSSKYDPSVLARFIVTFDIGLVTYDILAPKTAEKQALVEILDALLH